MIDTAGSLVKTAELIAEEHPRRIFACAVHGLFNGNAIERILTSPIERVMVTNSVRQKQAVLACEKIQVLRIGDLLAQAISRLLTGESLRSLGKE